MPSLFIGTTLSARTAISGLAMAVLLGAPLASTRAGTSETAVSECLKQLKLPRPVCACIGAKAENELNADQQRFFVAVITNNKKAQRAAQNQLTVSEMTETGNFMNRVPQECAKN